MSPIELATELLDAFARSDLERARPLVAEDVVIFGTDVGEEWSEKEDFLVALDALRALDLRARWLGTLTARDEWVAGTAEFTLGDGSVVPVRVTMVFADERLVHAHYSFASEESVAQPSSG
jgi:hypothetical protein